MALPAPGPGIPASSTMCPLRGSLLWQLRKLISGRDGERGWGGRADKVC